MYQDKVESGANQPYQKSSVFQSVVDNTHVQHHLYDHLINNLWVFSWDRRSFWVEITTLNLSEIDTKKLNTLHSVVHSSLVCLKTKRNSEFSMTNFKCVNNNWFESMVWFLSLDKSSWDLDFTTQKHGHGKFLCIKSSSILVYYWRVFVLVECDDVLRIWTLLLYSISITHYGMHNDENTSELNSARVLIHFKGGALLDVAVAPIFIACMVEVSIDITILTHLPLEDLSFNMCSYFANFFNFFFKKMHGIGFYEIY